MERLDALWTRVRDRIRGFTTALSGLGLEPVDGSMRAAAALESGPEDGSMSVQAHVCEGRVGELVIRVWDRGSQPDWYGDMTLFGPWAMYGAGLDEGLAGGVALGSSLWEAIYRLVVIRRLELERRRLPGEAVE